jgi:uncharacterized protein (TIGR02099 family)
MLAALYVSLGRQLVPLLAEYRSEVQSKAGEALRMPVSIGSLEGRWQGFAPVLLAHDVLIGDAAAQLRLEQVRVIPDLFASLLARQLRIAHLELAGVQLSLLQGEDGGWALQGLPQRPEQPPPQPAQVLEQLRKVSTLSVLDSQLILKPYAAEPIGFSSVGLTLRSGDRQRLDGRLLLPDGQPLMFHLNSRLRASGWRDTEAEAYLSLPQSDWAQWLPASLTGDWRIGALRAGGELWANWGDGGVTRAVARLHAPKVSAAYAGRKPVTMDNLALNAYYDRRTDGFDLLVDSLAVSLGETRWGEARLALAQRQRGAAEEVWKLAADRLDLTPLAPAVEALAPLPETLAGIIEGLQPRGSLHNVQLAWQPQAQGDKRVRFAANLERIAFNAVHGAPAAENVSGAISGDLGQGELRLDAPDFVLHLDHFFPQPWKYRQANARLTWSLDQEAFTLASRYMKVSGDEGEIAGDMLIRLQRDPSRESYMDLRVALHGGDARYAEKYLPTLSPALSPALANWLKTAIRGGRIDEGWFQYQGSLMPGAADGARAIDLFFKVRDAELAFQPGWPSLREARGEVFVEDSGVRVEVSEARLLDSRVSQASARVPPVPAGQVAHLLVDGKLASSVADGLKILQDTPLKSATQSFAGWRGEGRLDGRLKLEIPLSQGAQPQVQVDFATQGATLRIDKPLLELSQVSAAFRFDSARGLSAPDIRAQLFGKPVQGRIFAEGSGGKPLTRIEATGQVAVGTLADWLGVTQALPASGSIPYRLGVSIGAADSQLRIDSDLKGVSVELPAPFGKSAAEARNASWRMSLDGPERRMWADLQDAGSLALAMPANGQKQLRGELLLGAGSAVAPSDPGLQVRGQLAEFDLDAWKAALAQGKASAHGKAPVQPGDYRHLLRAIDLRIGTFKGFGQQLGNLGAQVQRGQRSWQAIVDSDLLAGRIDLPDDDGPIYVDLRRLRLPAADPVPLDPRAPVVEKPDALAHLDPHSLPALNLHIDQVFQGDVLLGAWSFKMRPNAAGARFSELKLGLKGLQITGEAGWEGQAGASTSWFKGELGGGNLSDVLLAWDFAPSVTSESFSLAANGRWPGSPAWFSMKRFSGDIEARLNKGQFVEVQGTASALRVFGLLNFNSIGRRLRLDFSDLLGKGLSYDRVSGRLLGSDGVFATSEPIRLTGPSSNLELNGTLDMLNDQIDAKLLVTLPVSNNLPIAALIAGAPAIGGALFVADKLFGDKVARLASVQYEVKGPLQEPKVNFFEKPK